MADVSLKETLVASQPVFAGRLLTVQVDTTELPDGRRVEREIVHHPGATAIVAVEDGQVVLVRQYRHAIRQTLLELPAGKLEAGEDPLDCAMRELAEETGLQAAHWRPLGKTVVSPGFCDEMIHLFRADGLTAAAETACDEDEVIEVVRLPWLAAVQAVRRGEITDAKTQVALLLAFGGDPQAGNSLV